MGEEEKIDFVFEKYRKQIAEMINGNSSSLRINFEDFPPKIKNEILNKPDETIKKLEKQFDDYLTDKFSILKHDYKIRINNLPSSTPIRDINSAFINKFVMIDGIITRIGKIEPILHIGTFICSRCGEPTNQIQQGDYIETPEKCDHCRRKIGIKWELDTETSIWKDVQIIRVQEDPENLPSGRMPVHINGRIYNKDLLNIARAGDHVRISGIIRPRLPYKFSNKKRSFDVYFEVNDIIVKKKDWGNIKISNEEIEEIKKIAEDPNLIPRLVNHIVPSIWGYSTIKEAILYLLFGGVTKQFADVKVRGEINILLCGDPSVAKSQLLKGVANIAPRGIYTSGKGSTAAGLTASVIKTDDHWTLEAGALVLGDKGITCIDELDKMDDKDRVAIHEALEQQTVSINKAGINATLPTRTAVLAAANPKFGRWEDSVSLIENLNFPATLLTRFDLIFVMKDLPSDKDEEMAEHVLNNFQYKIEKEISPDLFKKYIAYARRINPKMTRETIEYFKQYYIKMRNLGKIEGSIPITLRQLEALSRIAEARARIFLRDKVILEDAKRAVELMVESFKSLGMDIEHPDIDIKELGQPKTLRDKMILVYNTIKKLENEYGTFIEDIYIELEKKKMSRDEIEKILVKLKNEGKVFEPKKGLLKTI